MIQRLKKYIARWFRPKPVRARFSHARAACARCGRDVAHTKGGQPFLHHCRPLKETANLTAEQKERGNADLF